MDKSTNQPHICRLVDEEINQNFIVIEQAPIFEVQDVLKGVFVVLPLHYVFNMEYNVRLGDFYLFFEENILKIPTSLKKKYIICSHNICYSVLLLTSVPEWQYFITPIVISYFTAICVFFHVHLFTFQFKVSYIVLYHTTLHSNECSLICTAVLFISLLFFFIYHCHLFILLSQQFYTIFLFLHSTIL